MWVHIFDFFKKIIYSQKKKTDVDQNQKAPLGSPPPQIERLTALTQLRRISLERVIINLSTLVYVHWHDHSYIFTLNMRLQKEFFSIILWCWRMGHDIKNSDTIQRFWLQLLFSFSVFQIVVAWKLFWLVNHKCPLSVMLCVLH